MTSRDGTRTRRHGRLRRLAVVVSVVATASSVVLLVQTAAGAAPAPVRLTSASCPTDIVQGQNSGCVTELQNLLNAHGAGLVVDGDFGGATLAAVRTFQSSVAIAVDGRVGPVTKSRLYDTGGAAAPAPINLNSASCPTDVVRGQLSGCVSELQRLLRRHGYSLEIDGDFGADTETKVRAFQAAMGLAVDGRVGPDTKRSLYDTDEGVGEALDLRSSACPANIVEGMTGGCVTTLQALLNGKGQQIAVDGSFGPQTRQAVISFQTAASISVDGEVGPQTKAALYSNIGGNGGSGAPAPINLTSSACPGNIVQGQHSGCVTELQTLLNHHGAGLAVDGDFGPATRAAVLDFQSAANISVDGEVGPQTKSALYGIVLPPPPPPAGGGAANVLHVAEGELGVVEGSARANSYGSAVGLSQSTSGYAWCATFVSWVAKQTGASSLRHTYVVGWVNAARNHRYNLSVTESPRPGDIVAFDWNGGSDFNDGNEHIGIVRQFTSVTSFTTVEGNTGKPGGGPDGVWSKTRGRNQGYDVVFIRIGG